MKISAGILAYRKVAAGIEIFLVHPGGPFWKNKDAGSWSIPKGEFTDDETAEAAARREFLEETGTTLSGPMTALTAIRQKSGKTVYAWAVEKDIDAFNIKSNAFEMEWPPKSGQVKSFPEIDKAQWFSPADAVLKIIPAQVPLITELMHLLHSL